MKRIGLLGLGHWGPNYLRILSSLDNVQVVACADLDTNSLAKAKKAAPQARLTTQPRDILQASDVDAVIIATPTATHFELATEALNRGKHVLVEKPLAMTPSEAGQLTDLSQKVQRILMVGHTFLFNPGVQALKKMVQAQELGHLHYFNAMRANLGPIRRDVNALVDLAPHDISILLYILEKMPLSASALGACYLDPSREDVVFLTLRFPDNVLAQVHVSWLEPVKVRRVTVIGDRKMAVFNDIDVVEPIRIYDKGVKLEPRSYADFTEFRLIIREGDVLSPKVPFAEPLKNECVAFLEAIETGRVPLSDGRFGTQVVEILDAALQSLKQGGAVVPIKTRVA